MRAKRKLAILLRKIRSAYYTLRIKMVVGSFHALLKIHGKSFATRNVHLGKNVNFNGMKIVGNGTVHIGDNFHSGIECMIITQLHNYEGAEIPYDSTYILKNITIGDNVWLGNRVIILGGVTIGEGAIIQAGSVVVNDIPDCAIAGGHPARIFNYRDKGHYYQLKAEEKFH